MPRTNPKTHRPTGNYHSDPYTRAEAALDAFADVAVEENDERDTHDLISDLLTDLLHYCDETGCDFDVAISIAQGNFEEEIEAYRADS